jgi:nitrogen regulatory protein P-II 1
MKAVLAYIKPHRLFEVSQALRKIEGLTGASVMEIRGFGRGRAQDAPDRKTVEWGDVVSRVRLEIVCPDDLVQEIISTIERSAHTGLRGDGKIYVWNVEEAIRISTGERGEAAV